MRLSLPQLFSAVVLTAVCALPGSAHADLAAAETFVQQEHGSLKKLVDANAPSDQVQAKIDSMVDYDELTNRALGVPCPPEVSGCKNWKATLTDDQYKQVRDRLRKLVKKNYQKNLNKTRDYDVTYRGGKDTDPTLSKVRTEAKSKAKPRDPAVQVDYMIENRANQYFVIDIITEGSSMTKNYYDQFNRMFLTPNQGLPYLLAKLDKKIAKPVTDNSGGTGGEKD